jgi:hypothetical protein
LRLLRFRAAMACRVFKRIRSRAANPTSYSFPLPPDEVYAKALHAFSREHQYKEPIFGKSTERSKDDVRLESVLSVDCSTNVLSGNPRFKDPANAHDIFLSASHTPFTLSSVYCGRDGGLPFIAVFRLHMVGAGSNTVVTVMTSEAEVINGTKFGIGPCGPGQGWNCVKVNPTTVEEYSILRYLGRYLGVTNMPDVILPVSGLSE